MASQANVKAMSDADTRNVGNAWYILGFLLIVYSFNYADRYLIASLADPLKVDLGLSDAFVGMLMGPAFAVLYTVFSIPLATLADRTSRLRVLCGGCVFWSVFTVLSGLATDGWWLAAARIGVGIGEAAFVAPAYALLTESFAPNRRGTAFAILGVGVYLGQMGGYAIGPVIAATEGWRAAFFWVGAVGALVAILGYLTIREPTSEQAGTDRLPRPPLRGTIVRLWGMPTYWKMNVGAALGSFSGFAFAMWAPSFYVRQFGIPLADASTQFGLAFGVAGLIGMFAFGGLADRLTRSDARWPLRLSAFALCSATAAICCATLAPDMTGVVLIAIPSGLLGGGWSIGIFSSLQRLLSGNIRSTGTALFTFVTTFAGMVFGPVFVGMMSDGFGGGAAALKTALLIAIAPGFAGAMLLWSASRTLLNDQAAAAGKD